MTGASDQRPTRIGHRARAARLESATGRARERAGAEGYDSVVAGPETIVRRRLIDPFVDTAAVLIEAPSGYGKSVLGEQLISAWELAPIRVLLTGETGPGELVDRIRRAARRAGLGDLVAALAGDEPAAVLDNVPAL